MWVLDASEAWGIDRSIDQARKTMCNARQWVCESILALPYESQAALTWWEDQVPLFLKQKRFPVMVKERDIAHPIRPYQLPDRYFDLACCSHLLYHILGEQGKEAVVSAVREMIRVTKPGGWIVVDEPDEGVVQRYREFLEQAGLDVCRVDVDETVIQAGEKLTASTYYCQFRGR
jgi:SAM-dependent methyltransferase